VAYERQPGIKLKLFPATVQGEAAPKEIAKAIAKADRGSFGLLILARGGGAASDLAAFNTEEVVRAIAEAQTPVISGIGHETDITLADLAADLRAATPSHAAQIAVTAKETIQELIKEKEILLKNALLAKIDKEQSSLAVIEQKLHRQAIAILDDKQSHFAMLIQQLKLLDPLATLSRGYAICYAKDGRVLNDAALAAMVDNLQIQLAKGRLVCEVLAKE
jgi:exodeoxyribonuclease VII large subunit